MVGVGGRTGHRHNARTVKHRERRRHSATDRTRIGRNAHVDLPWRHLAIDQVPKGKLTLPGRGVELALARGAIHGNEHAAGVRLRLPGGQVVTSGIAQDLAGLGLVEGLNWVRVQGTRALDVQVVRSTRGPPAACPGRRQ